MYDKHTASTWGRKVRETPDVARVELAGHLKAHAGNLRALARELACGRVTLYRWLKQLGMEEAPGLARIGEALPWLEGPKSGPRRRKSHRAR